MSSTRTAGRSQPRSGTAQADQPTSPPPPSTARTSRTSRSRPRLGTTRKKSADGRPRVSRRSPATAVDAPDLGLNPATTPSGGGDPAADRSRRVARTARPPRLRSPWHRMLLAGSGVLGVGLLAVLLLNTVISQGAFRQFDLEVKLILLAEKEEALAATVQQAETPIEVERAARKLGMVPAAAPVFLRLADGKILGEPVPAPAPTGKVSFKDAPRILPTPRRLRPPAPARRSTPRSIQRSTQQPDRSRARPSPRDDRTEQSTGVDPGAGIDRAPVPRPHRPRGRYPRAAHPTPAPTTSPQVVPQ